MLLSGHSNTSGLRPNNSFKPNLLRSGNGVAEKACHAVTCTTQVGLTQALCGNAINIAVILPSVSLRQRLGRLRIVFNVHATGLFIDCD